MLWFPLMTVGIQMSLFGLHWDAVMRIVDHTPDKVFVGLQAIRVLAIGSIIIKWRHGIAFPDLLFGCSAWCLLLTQPEKIDPTRLLIWNVIVGFLFIVPFGSWAIVLLGMASTRLNASRNYLVFEYPHDFGSPGVVVPTILLSWNAVVAVNMMLSCVAMKD
jgi:hypothetical protein